MWRFLAAPACALLLFAQRAPVEAAWDLLSKGDRPQAVRVLHEILAANPRDADAHLLLGSVLAEDGDRSEAIAQLTEAVRLRPQSAEAFNALGEAFNNFGETRPAREAFAKAIQLDPKFAAAQVNLGQILVQSREFSTAAAHLDRALQLLGAQSDAAYPHYLRAKIDTEQNHAQNAATHLQEAVKLQPDFAEAWSDLGQARKTLLDDAAALAAFEHAVAAAPADATAQYRLGSEYLHQGDPHRAAQHLQQALDLNPGDQSTLYALQNALRRDGQPTRAAQIKQQLADLLQKRDQAAADALTAVQLNNQGADLEKSGRLREALDKYRAALQLSPQHVGFRINVAAALLRLGDSEQGIAELREALRQDPNNEAVKTALTQAQARSPTNPKE